MGKQKKFFLKTTASEWVWGLGSPCHRAASHSFTLFSLNCGLPFDQPPTTTFPDSYPLPSSPKYFDQGSQRQLRNLFTYPPSRLWGANPPTPLKILGQLKGQCLFGVWSRRVWCLLLLWEGRKKWVRVSEVWAKYTLTSAELNIDGWYMILDTRSIQKMPLIR